MIEVKLKFIPTGNVFTLPEYEARRILESDRGNYEIIGEQNNIEEEKITTTYEQVVQEETKDTEDKNFDDMTAKELKIYCEQNNIEFNKSDSKATILDKINRFYQTTKEETQTTEE